jgi:hypothetical protein
MIEPAAIRILKAILVNPTERAESQYPAPRIDLQSRCQVFWSKRLARLRTLLDDLDP